MILGIDQGTININCHKVVRIGHSVCIPIYVFKAESQARSLLPFISIDEGMQGWIVEVISMQLDNPYVQVFLLDFLLVGCGLTAGAVEQGASPAPAVNPHPTNKKSGERRRRKSSGQQLTRRVR